MKTIKNMMMLGLLAMGVNASAQMHEAKHENLQEARKSGTSEQAKTMPATTVKTQNTTPAPVENEQKMEQPANTNANTGNTNNTSVTPANTNQQSQENHVHQEMNRPVKMRHFNRIQENKTNNTAEPK